MTGTALDVAQAAGLDVRRKGGRWWACCAFHDEQTPSMCFYPDGKFYCYGCHKWGDAADLYAQVYDVPLGVARRAVGQELEPSPEVLRRRAGQDFKARCEQWRENRVSQCLKAKFEAESLATTPGVDAVTLDDALEKAARMQDEVNNLDAMDEPQDFLRAMKEGESDAG